MTKISIIWNVTARCPWNCAFCVMDAGKDCKRKELTLDEKKAVCQNIDIPNVRIDLSGGEVMFEKIKHLSLIEILSKKLGRDNIGISTSGYGIDNETARFLSEKVGDVEMTMDAAPGMPNPYREDGYHRTAGNAVRNLRKHGIRVGIQTVLTREHLEHPEVLASLYDWLRENEVDVWSLIRFFPSGRGSRLAYLAMDDGENLSLVERAKTLCTGRTGPSLDVHYLLPGSPKDGGCRCVKKSIGILPDGGLLRHSRLFLAVIPAGGDAAAGNGPAERTSLP